jgi:hypothetical protein
MVSATKIAGMDDDELDDLKEKADREVEAQLEEYGNALFDALCNHLDLARPPEVRRTTRIPSSEKN